MLDYSIINFDNIVIDATDGTTITGLFSTVGKIKSNTVKVINLVTNITDIVICGYCYVKAIKTDSTITAYKLIMGDLLVTIDSDDTVTAEILETDNILRFSTDAMTLIATGLDSEKTYKLEPTQDANGVVTIDIVEVTPEPTSQYCEVTFQCLNASFDSAIEVTITPDDDIQGGLGDETSVQFDVPTGTYSYTVTAVGYQDITGSLTIASSDLGNSKTITFNMEATQQQGGDNL